MLALGEESVKKGLKVGVGLMCRHCPARRELFEKIKDGALGDITLLRAYRVAGPTGSAFVHKMPEGEKSELLYQIRHFHGFLWASGGAFSDFLIHNIDECCWMKDAWPVSAKGYGGRHYRMDVRNGKEFVDQNFDVYTCEYTFADGSKLMLEGRGMVGCDQEFASYAHGTKGSAVISASSHWPSRCRISKTQDPHPSDKSLITWSCGKEPSENNPYQVEWEELMEAIRQDKPYNEVKRGAEASVVTSMGRMACHTGKIVTLDQMLSCDHEFAPTVGELTLDGPSPLKADKDGRYPTPRPGLIKREYEVKVS
jgi:predicted dehydrogenase